MAPSRPILLVTRPGRQGDRFVQDCAQRFGEMVDIVHAPIMQIVPRQTDIALDGVTGLVFSSQSAVDWFAANSDLRHIPAYCVGPRVTAAASALGLRTRQAGADAQGLIAALISRPPGGHLMHLRGDHARGDIAELLTAAGQPCSEAVVYDQIALELGRSALVALGGASPVILPLFSPRSARLLSRQIPSATAPLGLVPISAAVAEAWTGAPPVIVRQASRPDADAVLSALDDIIQSFLRVEGGGRPG